MSEALDWLLPLLAIPSISADPAHADDVRAAADFLLELCGTIGLRHTQLLEAPGANPVVYADWLDVPGRPTVLLYGHYDVQPVIDASAWTTPPFSPTIRDGTVVARGASDMKGPLVSMLAALAELIREGGVPVNVRLLLEGEEEIFSPRLPGIVRKHRDLLAGDLAVSADGSQPQTGRPRLIIGTRGLCDLQLIVRGARTDLHSGQYGGAAPNPAQIIAEIVSSFHDREGRVAVEGFYDDIEVPSATDRASITSAKAPSTPARPCSHGTNATRASRPTSVWASARS